jgi:Mn2+/Fe2+ NRAMP family transporter
MAVVMLMAGNKQVMGRLTLPISMTIVGWVATFVMLAASVGFFIL